MYGDFETDFRVTSAQTYTPKSTTNGYSHYVNKNSLNQTFSDGINPYLDLKEVAFKFKAVINTYIQKEIDLNMKMVDHLAHISKEDFSYLVYDQLKLQVRFYYGVEKKNLFGKVKTKWIHTSCKWKDFVETYQDKVRSGEVTIEDVSISKFALMVFSL